MDQKDTFHQNKLIYIAPYEGHPQAKHHKKQLTRLMTFESTKKSNLLRSRSRKTKSVVFRPVEGSEKCIDMSGIKSTDTVNSNALDGADGTDRANPRVDSVISPNPKSYSTSKQVSPTANKFKLFLQQNTLTSYASPSPKKYDQRRSVNITSGNPATRNNNNNNNYHMYRKSETSNKRWFNSDLPRKTYSGMRWWSYQNSISITQKKNRNSILEKPKDRPSTKQWYRKVTINPWEIQEEDKIFNEMNQFSKPKNQGKPEKPVIQSRNLRMRSMQFSVNENNKVLQTMYKITPEFWTSITEAKNKKDDLSLKMYQDNLINSVGNSLSKENISRLQKKFNKLRNWNDKFKYRSCIENIKEIEAREEKIIRDINYWDEKTTKIFDKVFSGTWRGRNKFRLTKVKFFPVWNKNWEKRVLSTSRNQTKVKQKQFYTTTQGFDNVYDVK